MLPDFHKSIRDPLYGFVDLTKLELDLIDTPMFQRLHRIKQLSHTYLAYPSATHTRFEHSIGALHVANMIAVHLRLDDEKREIIRLAALLHDIGHGPFSHLFEEVLLKLNGGGTGHEQVSSMIIREDEDVSGLLGDKAEMVAQLLEHKPVDGWSSGSTLASDIVSGSLDADKMDYLRRDSYHAGVEYGKFDLHRLVRTLTPIDDKETPLCIDAKGLDAVENYRLGRYLMHTQVYHHHARLVGDRMFLSALNEALGGTVSKDLLTLRSDPREFLAYYGSLDDFSICDMIMKHGGWASNMLGAVTRRVLLKRAVDIRPLLDIADYARRRSLVSMTPTDLDDLAREIAEDAQLDPRQVILYVSAISIKLYGDPYGYQHDRPRDDSIMVIYKGIPRNIWEVSPISASQQGITKFYAFGPPDESSQRKIRERVESKFHITR